MSETQAEVSLHITREEQKKIPLRVELKAEHQRLCLHLDKNAKAIVTLNYAMHPEATSQLFIQTTLEEGAKLQLLHCCDTGAIHHIRHEVKQYAHSALHILELTLRAKKFSQIFTAELLASEAACIVKGCYIGDDKEDILQQLTIHHEAPYCKSEQFFKGVLKDHAKVSFEGKVVVGKDAKKTEARQRSDAILLSAHTEVETKPELEIYNDDVICTHGATVGELDQEALFYLTSRGLEESQAKRILLSAFLKEVLGEFSELAWPKIENYV
jgi:Fe-S cluster assembly protein SufD